MRIKIIIIISLLLHLSSTAQNENPCEGLPPAMVDAGDDLCACIGEQINLNAEGNADCYYWIVNGDSIVPGQSFSIEFESASSYTVCGIGPDLCWKKCDAVSVGRATDEFSLEDETCCFEKGHSFSESDFIIESDNENEEDCIGNLSDIVFDPPNANGLEFCYGQSGVTVSAEKYCSDDTIRSANSVFVKVIDPDHALIESELSINISKNNPAIELNSTANPGDCSADISGGITTDILGLVDKLRGIVDRGSDGINWGVNVTAEHEVKLKCCPSESESCSSKPEELDKVSLSVSAFGGYLNEKNFSKYVKAIIDAQLSVSIEGSNDPNCESQGFCFGSDFGFNAFLSIETDDEAIAETLEPLTDNVFGGDDNLVEEFIEEYVDIEINSDLDCSYGNPTVCWRKDMGVYFDIEEPCCTGEVNATIKLFNLVNIGGNYSIKEGNCLF